MEIDKQITKFENETKDHLNSWVIEMNDRIDRFDIAQRKYISFIRYDLKRLNEALEELDETLGKLENKTS